MKKVIGSIFHLLSGTLLTAASLAGLFVLVVLLVIYYFFYRLLWLVTPKGAILRAERNFKRTKEKLLSRESRQRTKYSRSIDEQDIQNLLVQINQELHVRKTHIDQHILNETRYLLDRCQTNLDFAQALTINDLIVQTPVGLLNSALNKLLNESENLK